MKYKIETAFFNHISRVFHIHRWDAACEHNEASLRLFLGECAIDREGVEVLVEWALPVGLKCACELVNKIPQILINNPYYFPSIKLKGADPSYFTVRKLYPLVDFISALCAEDMLSIIVVGDEVGENEESTKHEYLKLDCYDLSNLSFGEVHRETLEGWKDSDWSLVFCFDLDEESEKLKKLKVLLDIGGNETDGGPDISDFIEAYYREDDHE